VKFILNFGLQAEQRHHLFHENIIHFRARQVPISGLNTWLNHIQAHFVRNCTCFSIKNHKKRHKLPEYQQFYKVFNGKIAGKSPCQKNYMVKYQVFKPGSLFRLFRLFLFYFVEQAYL